MDVQLWLLYVCLQPVHIDGTVVLVPVASLVMRGMSMFLLLRRPNALLELDQASHVRRELAARRRRLVAAVLLVLVGHHLLDAYHGLRLADQRHLVEAGIVIREGLATTTIYTTTCSCIIYR